VRSDAGGETNAARSGRGGSSLISKLAAAGNRARRLCERGRDCRHVTVGAGQLERRRSSTAVITGCDPGDPDVAKAQARVTTV
jgi:hypothetical protein